MPPLTCSSQSRYFALFIFTISLDRGGAGICSTLYASPSLTKYPFPSRGSKMDHLPQACGSFVTFVVINLFWIIRSTRLGFKREGE
jgi:hypothetical protein